MEFAPLLAAGVTWFALHAGIAGSPVRSWLVERLGGKRYRGAFSLASVVTLVWLVMEYRQARYLPLWVPPQPLRWVPIAIMPLAFVLLAGAFTVPSPTAVGGEKLLHSGAAARGMLRITRHPFLWSAVLWSLAHLVANSDVASLILFGSVGGAALRGTFDIDRKRRRTNPAEFGRFEAVTSNLPLAAVLAGRNRVVLRELWLPLLLGLALALATVALHPRFFGAPAVPALDGS